MKNPFKRRVLAFMDKPSPASPLPPPDSNSLDVASLEAAEGFASEKSSPTGRLGRVVKPIAGFFGVQLVVQALSLVAGLILVRALSKSEYALYTLANTMQATMGLLADIGVSSALSAIGGQVWREKTRLGQLISTAMEFRRKFFLAAALVIGPILFVMLRSHNAGVWSALALCALVIYSASLELTIGVLIVVPRLHSRVKQLQNLDLWAALLRAALLGLAFFTFLNAFVGIVVATLAYGLQAGLLKKWAAHDADLKAAPHVNDRKFIADSVKNLAPTAIYYCVQSQLTLFLISFFGKTNGIAEIGAISRFSMVFVVFNSLLQNLLLPKFARAQQKSHLKRVYWQTIGGYSAILTTLFVFLTLFRTQALWILGPQYQNLGGELLIYFAGSVAACIAGVVGSLNRAKAWVNYSWIYIPISIFWSLLLLFFLDMSQTRDAIIFGALSFVPILAVQCARSYFGFREMEKTNPLAA